MKIKHFLVLLVLALSTGVFGQTDSNKHLSQSYLVSRNEKSGDWSRPRIYRSESPSSLATSPKKSSVAYNLERKAFELINQQRAQNNLEPLEWSEDAAKIARMHSENMANYGFFSHTGIDGSLVNDRADVLGIRRWQAIGENIAYNRGFENPVEFAVERWMLSPKHRDNLLNGRWKESGIGIAVTKDGTYYFTEVFLVRK